MSDLTHFSGRTAVLSEKPKAGAQKSTAASRARGPKKPAGQVSKQEVPTKFPVLSSIPTSTVTGGDPIPTAKERVPTPNKTNRSTPIRNSPRRSGQADRAPGGKADLVTRFTVSGRTGAPTAPQKPTHLKSDAEKWKTEYDKHLKEAQNTQVEQEKAKRHLEKIVAELTQTLAVSKNHREHAEIHAATLEEEVICTRLDLELCRKENCNLKLDKEKLIIQVNNTSGLMKDLQTQANLAGQLQTKFNSLSNVRVPFLEQENKMLKQELSRMLENVETPPSALVCAPLPVQADPMGTPHDDLDINSKALLNFLKVNEVYVNQLKTTCAWLETEYADAVFELDDMERHIAILQSTTGHLKNQYDGLFFGNSQLPETPEDFQVEKRVLGVVNASTKTALSVSTASSTSAEPSLAGVVALVQTEPLSSHHPDSMFSKIAPVIEAISRFMLESSTPFMSSSATQSTNSVPSPEPRAPLDQDIQITINIIMPTAQADLSLLQRLTAITTKDKSFKINGPTEIAKALAHSMEDARARAKQNEVKVLELQQMMWQNISELERMKKSACNMTGHRSLVDQLAAMEARLQMQDMLLVDNGRQLAQLKKVQALQ